MTNADAARLYRARKAGKAEPLTTCSCCGKQARRPTDGLCSRCWAKTPAGKAATAERVRRHREKAAAET